VGAAAAAIERRRLRLQRRRAAAEMLVAGMTQARTAEALGISDRTIRNWMKGKAFQSALARAQTRAERQSTRAQERAARRRAALAQQNAARRPELRAEQDPEATPDPRTRRGARAYQSEHARWLDEQDARRPYTRAELESEADRAAAAAVAAGGGIEAIVEATGFKTRANVLRNINPAILERARENDAARAAAGERDAPS
jgi:transcriptional regulator with XRE-family HTH domain